MNGAFDQHIDTTITTTTTTREVRTGVTTSVVEEFGETRADRVVSTNIAQTMRARDITVTGENFRPSHPYYVFFDGINVNEYVTPSGQAIGTTLSADPFGSISAVFSIPNTDKLNFSTGSKTLKITESSTNNPDSPSQGTAQYAANGELKTIQEEIISTRNGRIIIEELSDARQTRETLETVETRTIPGTPVTWVDPLAQSFLVDVVGGIFVTSVELYFAIKDTAFPVSVQLRHMENGMPTQKIVPFGEKTLLPTLVNTSTDASTSTKFSFPSPVYLEAGNEYCVVVMTNSNEYTIWVSEMGGRDIQTNDFIDQQPYAGSLFKSQNNSTWTPDQMRDLKLTINRAKFTTGTAASVVFDNSAIPADALGANPVETISGTKTFRVYHYSHGNYDQLKSNIIITGVIGDRINSVFSFADDTIAASDTVTADAQTLLQTSVSPTGGTGCTATITTSTSASTSIVITNPGQGYAVGDQITFTKDSETIVFAVAAVADTLGGIPIQYINTTHIAGTSASGSNASSKIMSDIDEYLITIPLATWPARTSGTDTSPNYQASTESSTGGGSSVTATPNVYFDTLHTMIPSIELPNTSILPTFLATSATQATYLANPAASYVKDTSSTTITLNDNNSLLTPKIVASGINESSEMGSANSFVLTTQLSTTANNVSPILDVDSIGAIGIQNRVNNIDSTTDIESGTFVPATLAKGDNNAAIYMTKKVQLENPANSIHVLFDGYKAPDASGTNPEIKVYYKVMGPDDNLQFNDIGWTLATIKSTVQPDATDFKEHAYEIESLEDFTAFSIKVVLQSVNSANVPFIENFRAIALST